MWWKNYRKTHDLKPTWLACLKFKWLVSKGDNKGPSSSDVEANQTAVERQAEMVSKLESTVENLKNIDKTRELQAEAAVKNEIAEKKKEIATVEIEIEQDQESLETVKQERPRLRTTLVRNGSDPLDVERLESKLRKDIAKGENKEKNSSSS